jgi:hypothetical protein
MLIWVVLWGGLLFYSFFNGLRLAEQIRCQEEEKEEDLVGGGKLSISR